LIKAYKVRSTRSVATLRALFQKRLPTHFLQDKHPQSGLDNTPDPKQLKAFQKPAPATLPDLEGDLDIVPPGKQSHQPSPSNKGITHAPSEYFNTLYLGKTQEQTKSPEQAKPVTPTKPGDEKAGEFVQHKSDVAKEDKPAGKLPTY